MIRRICLVALWPVVGLGLALVAVGYGLLWVTGWTDGKKGR